jgi:hypothetical protein
MLLNENNPLTGRQDFCTLLTLCLKKSHNRLHPHLVLLPQRSGLTSTRPRLVRRQQECSEGQQGLARSNDRPDFASERATCFHI